MNKSLLKFLKTLVLTLVLSYLVLCVTVYSFQHKLLYHPTPNNPYETANTLPFQVNGAVLKMLVKEKTSDTAVIFFGGNAENVAVTLPKYAEAFPDYALYAANYRGYSGSTGEVSETNLHADALQFYDYVKTKHAHIIVIGRSLGSGVAIKLAAEHEVSKLILITPYDSILNIAKQTYCFLPVSLMLKDRFESTAHAPKIKASTLILTAEYDNVIPLANSQALQSAFKPGIANLIQLKQTDHNTISAHPDYYQLIHDF